RICGAGVREAENLDVLAVLEEALQSCVAHASAPSVVGHGGDAGMVQKAAAPVNSLFRAARQLQEFCDAFASLAPPKESKKWLGVRCPHPTPGPHRSRTAARHRRQY